MAMHKVLRDMWVEALRSGEYEQGAGALCDADGKRCCLGVLNDIIGTEVEANLEVPGDPWYFRAYFRGRVNESSEQGLNSSYLQEWTGLPSYLQGELAEANDAHVPFAEIADRIEREVRVWE